MAKSCCEISVAGEFKAVDADGTACSVCECQCLLSQFQLIVTVEGCDSQATDVVLCGACHEVYEDAK